PDRPRPDPPGRTRGRPAEGAPRPGRGHEVGLDGPRDAPAGAARGRRAPGVLDRSRRGRGHRGGRGSARRLVAHTAHPTGGVTVPDVRVLTAELEEKKAKAQAILDVYKTGTTTEKRSEFMALSGRVTALVTEIK